MVNLLESVAREIIPLVDEEVLKEVGDRDNRKHKKFKFLSNVKGRAKISLNKETDRHGI